MADFSVDTAKLRDLAGSLDGRTHEARTLLRRASAGAVPAETWGPLGHQRGLPDLYTDVRAQADATLGRIFDSLGTASEALLATAGDYDAHEERTARSFTRIDARRSS